MTKPNELFAEQIKLALDNYGDTEWLGKNSALATPYFLGDWFHKTEFPMTIVGRGQALQELIDAAADKLWSGPLPADSDTLEKLVEEERAKISSVKSYRLSYLLLELGYFRRYFPPSAYPSINRDEIRFYLSLSGRGAYYRLFKNARERLGDALLQIARPTFRLESPNLQSEIFGRDIILEKCLEELSQNRMLAISGRSGIGKTTIGTAIQERWQSPTFWYTFRPNFSDNIDSLFFSLGHFLNKLGKSTLWLYLISVDKSETSFRTDLATGFLQDDIHNLPTDTVPLLCFDEVDLLDIDHLEEIQPQHQEILDLLETLRSQLPLLLLGQSIAIITDNHIVIKKLDRLGIRQFVEHSNLPYSKEDIARIMQITDGNPRMVELVIALCQLDTDETLQSVLSQLPTTPAIRPLLNRLWRRLSPNERTIVSLLSVFQASAPLQAAEVDSLLGRGLLKLDANGGYSLNNIFQASIYQSLSSEKKEQYHEQAAHIRANHGEFTEAAYHFYRAGNPRQAVELFHNNLDLEITRGKSRVANDIFQSISIRQLKGKPQRDLQKIRAQLSFLTGNPQKIIEDTTLLPLPALSKKNQSQKQPDPTAEMLNNGFEITNYQGIAYTALGEYESALDAYDHALHYLATLTKMQMTTIRRRSQVLFRYEGFHPVFKEIEQAEFELAFLKGLIMSRSGQHEEAKHSLHIAQEIADKYDDPLKIAKIAYEHTVLAGMQGKLETAKQSAQTAITAYQKMGNLFDAEVVRAELGGAHLQAGVFEEAVLSLEKSLKFFSRIKAKNWIINISSNLAEAYHGVGDLNKAKKYAMLVRDSEDRQMMPYGLFTLGLVWLDQGNLPKAESSFKEGIEIAQQVGDKFVLGYLLRGLGKLYCRSEQTQDEGHRQLEKAVALFQEMSLTAEVEKTHAIISSFL